MLGVYCQWNITPTVLHISIDIIIISFIITYRITYLKSILFKKVLRKTNRPQNLHEIHLSKSRVY